MSGGKKEMTNSRDCCYVCPYEDECGDTRFSSCKVRKRYDADPQEWRDGYAEYMEQDNAMNKAILGE
jgi:hypothetical protein